MAADWLKRQEAAAFLASIGCPVTPRTLANLAMDNNKGGGPPFTRTGWRTVYYNRDDLRVWAAQRAKRVE